MKHNSHDPGDIIAASLTLMGEKNVAMVSSFGAESVVLLHLVAQQSKDVPVFFIDTGKHFSETLAYRKRLIDVLGLNDTRVLSPVPAKINEKDPQSDLHKIDPDACCKVRKIDPLREVRGQFDAWFTGRKRYQAETRAKLPIFEFEDKGAKINPLVNMTNEAVLDYIAKHDLPRHPLTYVGYPSIGCEPCTSPASEDDQRAGRWRGVNKTECGIHLSNTHSETMCK